MARPQFKRWWTQFVPKSVERGTYVLFASLALVLLFWQWRPMPAVAWEIADATIAAAVTGLSLVGFVIVLTSTFLINHFELFGLHQVANNVTGRTMPNARFRTPLYYKFVRHPIYLGFIIAFWAAPTMTVGHLLFAAVTTAYIFIGILLEERDLVDLFGDEYRRYKERVSMLVPWRKAAQSFPVRNEHDVIAALNLGRPAVLDRVRDHIDYDEAGTGPTIVLVPGSCSTGAAWRPVIAAFKGRFRCVTTSLLGYGGTAERRSAEDPSISHEAEALEWVIQKAGGRVHLVGHSFGGCVSLAVALRKRVELASLTILEAPAIELLAERNEHLHHRAIRRMTAAYFAAFESGNQQAIATVIDFYGGAGAFASWPERVRAYAVEKTAVNILDWASAYGFPLSTAALGAIDLPTLIATGRASHPAMHAANALLSQCISGASLAAIDGAAHFMIASHAGEVARLIAEHVSHAERVRSQRRVLAAVK